ncbi:MAG: DUF3795 domain-containing protein [Actinobacteria bacterium]|nr:DUF3795 domain-containing protein [Actinomycetota bacterium]
MAGDEERMTAYCGLYCEDCAFHTGAIPDLARDLRKELRAARFEKVAEVIPFLDADDYRRTYDFLGSLVKLRCKGCKVGSRSQFCHIAQCAAKLGYQGCWECGEFATCTKLDFLVPVHGDAHLKNLRKIKKVGVKEWAEGDPLWYAPPRKPKGDRSA